MKKQLIVVGIFSLFMGFIFLNFLNVAEAVTTAGDFAYLKATFLNQDPDPAEPGKYVELRWKIEKFGSDELKEVTFLLEPQYPFSFDSSDVPEKNIGNWVGYSGEKYYYSLYYKIKVDENAIEDNYPIKLKYKGSGNSWTYSEYNVFVQKKDKPEFVLGSMVTVPTKLVADTEDAELQIGLQNIGDGDAENVKVEIQLPQGFVATYGYSDQSNLGSIESGVEKTASFFVDIDERVTSGEHQAKLIISYKEKNDEDNEYKTKTINVKIPVKNKPLFEIINVKSNIEKIKAGDIVELRVQLKNTGSKEAKSVSLRAFKESSQPFDFEDKSDFVGNLKAGQVGEAVLKFTVDNEAITKEYLLDLEIRAIDGDKVLLWNKTIEVNVVNEEKQDISNQIQVNVVSLILIVTVVVLLLIVAYFIGTKRRKNKL